MAESIFPSIVVGPVDDATFAEMDRFFNEWTMRAARGECSWICSDCCMSFREGMPDECGYGHQRCTDIIRRDKSAAKPEGGK